MHVYIIVILLNQVLNMQIDFSKVVINPKVVFRDDFEDAAVVYNPETEIAYGLNPTGVIVWKMLDGKHSLSDIVSSIKRQCDNVPDEVDVHLEQFVKSLIDRGIAGHVI